MSRAHLGCRLLDVTDVAVVLCSFINGSNCSIHMGGDGDGDRRRYNAENAEGTAGRGKVSGAASLGGVPGC